MKSSTQSTGNCFDAALDVKIPAHGARRKRAGETKPIQEIASEFGLSARQLYRLRGRKPEAGARDGVTACSFRVSARLLSEIGHGDLLATDVQTYLAMFIAEFVINLGEHAREAATPLDPRWAKGNARNAIEQLRAATRRREERLQMIMDNE
jgi:hypothetical protein